MESYFHKFSISSTCEVRKALLFALFITAWTTLSILPLQLDRDDNMMKIIFTVLACFPIPFVSYYFFVAFIYVLFNKNPDDDRKINIIAFMIIVVTWIISWSSVLLIFWTWHPAYYLEIEPTQNAYKVWGELLAVSMETYAANSPLAAATHNVWVALTLATESVLSVWINIVLFSIVVTLVHTRVIETNKKRKHHHHKAHVHHTQMNSPEHAFTFFQ